MLCFAIINMAFCALRERLMKSRNLEQSILFTQLNTEEDLFR